MNRFKNAWGLLLVLGVLLILFSRLPLATAFEFSSDEGYEVMKPFLLNQGHALYTEIWNNMPPIYTFVLAYAFKLFGTSIVTARLVAAGFGLILFATFHDLIRQRSGQWCALIATFLLLSSPPVLLLSVAAMLEVPAMATGLLAAWLLFQWKKQRHWLWLFCSGVVMGLALQTKPTAVLLIPAIVLEFTMLAGAERGQPFWRNAMFRNLFLWLMATAAMALLIGFTCGKGSLEPAWKSHTITQAIPGFERVEDHPFNSLLLRTNVECCIGATVGIVLAFARRRAREIVFPLALLPTDALIHAMHQPWWDYYYLHFAIPLAWLAGWAVNEVIQDVLGFHAKYRFKLFRLQAWKQWALCLLVAFVIARSEARLEWIIRDLRKRPSSDANPIVRKIKEYGGHSGLIYSERGLYAFHTRLPVPPQLAVVAIKRFWSGQITTAEIIEICKRYNVQMIVLPKGRISEQWTDFLNAEYIKTTSDEDGVLFVSKALQPTHE